MEQVSNLQAFTLIWFTNQLRVEDNRLLAKAKEINLPTIAIYCLDDKFQKPWVEEISRMSDLRKAYLFEQLKEFHADLQQLNISLLITEGDTAGRIEELTATYNIQSFIYPMELGPEELSIQNGILEKIPEKIQKHEVVEGFLLDPLDASMDFYETPEVYTDFRKQQEKQLLEYEEIKPSVFPKHHIFFKLPNWNVASHESFAIPPGEQAGQARLSYYLWESKKAAQYKQTRNGLIGTDFSTRFSPYLASGTLSPRNIYREVKRFERKVKKNSSTYWIVFELLWRDFFRYMLLKHGKGSFYRKGYNGAKLPDLTYSMEKATAWIKGKTSSAFINAGMKELRTTGWLSNRMRQNVASYLINDLGIDWRIGAAYFEEQLIDYDVCSNTGNWLYLSGYGNDPRGRRIFNTDRQQQQYDPNQDYIQKWLMEKTSI